MEAGATVWIRNQGYRNPDSDDLWIPSVILQKGKKDEKQFFTVKDDYGERTTHSLSPDELEDFKYRNALDTDEVEIDNLVDMPISNEPEILFCLKNRFFKDHVYTQTGKILIAINPLREIAKQPYNEKMLFKFAHDVKNAQVRTLKRRMSSIRPLMPERIEPPRCLCSVILMGESGSGKTETFKAILQHMIDHSGETREEEKEKSQSMHRQLSDSAEVAIMDKIVFSNHILEAFGNSKTSRNNNSSRFGKLVNLEFDEKKVLIGCTMKRYLLESARVVKQQSNERNFHIFYQLLAGGSEKEMTRWHLDALGHYNYISQNKTATSRTISDRKNFFHLCHCLESMNFQASKCNALFDVVAGLVHLGQVQFNKVVDYSGDVSEIKDLKITRHVARLCGFLPQDLEIMLTSKVVNSRGEEFKKRFTPMQSIQARDSITKTIYKVMFDWLVREINANIAPFQPDQFENEDENLTGFGTGRLSVGILDIFGFECLPKNYFEQLCINFTNETLQQQFNMYMFKMELQEFAKENIDCKEITFMDNQDSAELIGTHIFQILDDQCKLPNSTDQKFAAQVYKDLMNKPKFSASKAEQHNCSFTVLHYTGKVAYSADKIVEKNVDVMPHGIISLLERSSNVVISALSSTEELLGALLSSGSSELVGVKKSASPTVSNQFKSQLTDLMNYLDSTVPHYIRCIVPIEVDTQWSFSASKVSHAGVRFHDRRVLEQLYQSGIMDAIRLARSGYPVRLNFSDFYKRYRPLLGEDRKKLRSRLAFLPSALPADATPQQVKDFCGNILGLLFPSSDGSPQAYSHANLRGGHRSSYSILQSSTTKDSEQQMKLRGVQLGVSKVFLRQFEYDQLESRRARLSSIAGLTVQKFMRGSILRLAFLDSRFSVIVLQSYFRGFIARRRYLRLRLHFLVTLTQKMTRGWLARVRFRKILTAWYRTKIVRFLVVAKFKKHLRRFKSAVIRLQYLHRRRHCRPGQNLCIQSMDESDLQPMAAKPDDIPLDSARDATEQEEVAPVVLQIEYAAVEPAVIAVAALDETYDKSFATVSASISAEPMESPPTKVLQIEYAAVEPAVAVVTVAETYDKYFTTVSESISAEPMESPPTNLPHTSIDDEEEDEEEEVKDLQESKIAYTPPEPIHPSNNTEKFIAISSESVTQPLPASEELRDAMNGNLFRPNEEDINFLSERRKSRSRITSAGGWSRSDNPTFRTLQDKLYIQINELIDSFRITAKEALLRFDLSEARRSLEAWTNKLPPGDVRSRIKVVIQTIDYGYNLITANNIIPLVMAAKLMKIGSSKPENRIISARSANKVITKEHGMFETITFLVKELEWLALGANREKERLYERMKRRGRQKSNNLKDKEEFHYQCAYAKSMEHVAEQSWILHQYYQNYILTLVEEYGPESAFKAQFVDEVDYIRSFARLVGENIPLLSFEKRLMGVSAGVGVGVGVGVDEMKSGIEVDHSQVNPFTEGGRAGQVVRYKDVAFRCMPYAPGLDYVLNNLTSFLSDRLVYPTRLIRLLGKNSSNYGKVVIYQASMSTSSDDMRQVLSDDLVVDAVNFKDLSAHILSSMIAGVGELKPEDIMLKVTSQENASNIVERHANICSVTVDSSVQDAFLDFQLFSAKDSNNNTMEIITTSEESEKSLKGLNFLFFFPQMFEPVDPDIVEVLTKSSYAAMEITCEWLKELVNQNKLYENLVCEGSPFTEDDLTSLQLPVMLPLKTGSFIFNRLSHVSRLLRKDPLISHYNLLAALSPSLCQMYDQMRPPRETLDTFRDMDKFPLDEMYSKAFSDVSNTPSNVNRAFARRQQMLRSEEESLGLQSKGACFISPHPNSFYPLSASSFSMGQLSGGSHDDDGVEYQIYSRQNDEVKMIDSPLRFFPFSSKNKRNVADKRPVEATLKSKSLDFASPRFDTGFQSDTPHSNTKAALRMNLSSPQVVSPPTDTKTLSASEDVCDRFCCSVLEVIYDFLYSLDFQKLDDDKESNCCRAIGESLCFVEKMSLFKISELQLRAMFGGFIALALSDQAHRRHRNSSSRIVSMAVKQTGFKLKSVTIRGWVPKVVAYLKKKRIVMDMETLLGIDVIFISEVDQSSPVVDDYQVFLPVDTVHISLTKDKSRSMEERPPQDGGSTQSLLVALSDEESPHRRSINQDTESDGDRPVKNCDSFNMSAYDSFNIFGKKESSTHKKSIIFADTNAAHSAPKDINTKSARFARSEESEEHKPSSPESKRHEALNMGSKGEVNSRLPSDSSVQASESVAVFSWDDPSFWKMDSTSITTPTSSSASSGTLTSKKKEHSPDQKPSPTTTVGDTGKISKLIASHGVFKMDNPLSKASTPRNQSHNSRRLRDLAPLSSRKNSDAQEPILKSSSGETESTPPSNYTNHTIR